MNKFDQLAGLSEVDEGLGFLKKLRKKAKSRLKKVAKIASAPVKFTAKTTRKVGRKSIALHKRVVKAAVVKPLKKTGSKLSPIMANPMVQNIAMAAATATGVGALGVPLIKAAGTLAQANESDKANKAAEKAYKEAQAEYNDPEYQAMLSQMQTDGMTPQQIEREYLTSDLYRETAIPAVANAILPEYQMAARNAGVKNYEQVGAQLAAREAIDTVNTVQNKASGGNIAIPAAIAAAAAFLL